MYKLYKVLVAGLFATLSATAVNPLGIDYSAEFVAATASGAYAPYMMAAGRNGLLSRKHTALLDVSAVKPLSLDGRFSWSVGVELAAGYQSASDYEIYDAAAEEWGWRTQRPGALHVQQLYGTLRYRRVQLTVGQKSPESYLTDDNIAAGDFTRSNNAPGIPGVNAGFVDFVDVPLTVGWVQIDGNLEYGRFTDNSFRRGQFNYYNDLVATDIYYTYKRCHLRSNPSKPFCVTIGVQGAGQFGGSTQWYNQGVLSSTENRGFSIKDALRMMVPIKNGGEGFFTGNSLGSFDVMLRYRLRDGSEFRASIQNPWEDGSGMAKQNGWDGIWTVSYHRPGRHILSSACVQYLDFTNECGHLHWAPGDYPGTSLIWWSTGGDNYYNNDVYGAYANFGMAIGTPFLMAPVYNKDGIPFFAHNMAKGFHAGASGSITDEIDWRAAVSYQKAWGQGRVPQMHPMHDTSAMVEAVWRADRLLSGLRLTGQLAFDSGSLRGDSFGVLVGIRYGGNFSGK